MTDPTQPLSPNLLMQYAPGLRALVRRLVLDDSRVDDVLQETWLAALENPPNNQAALGSWLRTVASRLAYKTTRNDHHRSHHESRAAHDDQSPSAADIVEREMARRRVVDAVLELREPYRATILHRFLENLSASEIAERFDLPVETVRTRVKRGIEKLRRILDDRHDGDYRSWHRSLILLTTLPVGTVAQVAASSTLFGLSVKALWLAAAFLLMTGLFGYVGVSLWPAATPVHSFTVQFTADELAPSEVPEFDEPDPDDDPAPTPERDVVMPATTPPQLTLEGRIVDAAARPVAGAEVSLYLWPRWGTWRGWRGRFDEYQSKRFKVERSVRTGPDGTYRFEGPAFEETALIIAVQHAHYAPTAHQDLWHHREAELHLADTVIATGRAAFGRVLDAHGNPQQAVQVNLRPLDRPLDAAVLIAPVETNIDGNFHFDHVPVGRFIVEAVPAERLTASRLCEPRGMLVATDCGVLVVRDGTRIVGRIRDEYGNPIANAKVRAIGTTGRSSTRSGVRSGRSRKSSRTRSDAEGHFSLLLAPGEFSLECEHTHYTAVREPLEVKAGDARTGDVAGIALTMHPRFAITGRVLDRETGTAISNFDLELQRVDSNRRGGRSRRRSLETAAITILADGGFRIDNVEPGTYRVTIDAPPAAKTTLGPFEWQQSHEVTLHADRGFAIEGLIIDANTEGPLPGAHVQLRPGGSAPGAKERRNRQTTTADSSGRFDFQGQSPGEYEIKVRIPNRPPTIARVTLQRATLDAGTLRIERETVVYGVVRGLGSGRRAVVMFRNANSSRYETSINPRTGKYEIRGLEPGAWTVDILPRDAHGEYYQRYTRLDDMRQDLILGDAEVRRYDASVQIYGSLRGRVRHNGRPGTDLEVRLRRAAGSSDAWSRMLAIRVPTDATGDYLIEAIPHGTYNLEIYARAERRAPRLHTENIEIRAGQSLRTDPEVRTWPVTITLTGAPAGVTLKFTAAEDAKSNTSRRRPGNTRRWLARQDQLSGHLPQGRWKYELEGPDIAVRTGTIDVDQALDLAWDISLRQSPKNR